MAIWQKSVYHAKYLRMFWTYLGLLFRFGRRISGDDFPNIRFAAAQGTLLWQPFKYGTRLQTSRETTFTLWFGIRQRIGRSEICFKTIQWQQSGYIVSKFGELTSSNLGVYAVKTRNFCRDASTI